MATHERWNEAVRAFWTGRDLQTQRQIESGKVDAGNRGAVTGGQHLKPLEQATAALFSNDPDIGSELVVLHGKKNTLPGYYRRSKDWDLVVLYRGALVAAIEFKSQQGSFGNNFNNRTEESIGNSIDIWRGHEEEMFGPVRPWLGFVMVLEKTNASTRTMKNGATLFPADPAFNDTGYLDRYRILFQRLVREGKYDAAVVAATEIGQGYSMSPSPISPLPT
ncbi:PaeR7I family type II restriction endonuclease [Ornithinimicrobium sp. INDO-MA30-4]|uniref:PaeR7I family type II restriction endonuclease n=1 Tax=Ornithinimicrobium sp. INDO-MA30-4 TaxID=2908651 RepID=UPI001F48D18F|nr:PaeR7I family type II restriction endonuclease [Ornithinimicrobium sp. INDO-MA30-4]UJH71734.1 PaeR7I family type II restriction endonuclease [Ornithinimicrobium sp. INDO-MA30-4]